jgi:hypothetical protein
MLGEKIVERALFEASIRTITYPIFALRWQLVCTVIDNLWHTRRSVAGSAFSRIRGGLHVLMEKKRMMEPNRTEPDEMGWGGLYLCRMNQ